jgi:RES domain-containing protein
VVAGGSGDPLLYCSSTISLSCIETLVHLAVGDPLPLNRYLVRIPIPPTAWKKRTVFVPADQVGWDAQPPGLVSMDWGTAWAESGGSLIAEVPSVVVPEESNVLINPRHADVAGFGLRSCAAGRMTYGCPLSAPRAPAPLRRG